MGNAGSHSRDFETLRRYFEDHDQGHVFRFWSVLDAAARARLLAQARAIELPALIAAYRRSLESAAPRARKLEPVPAERTAERGGDPAKIADASNLAASAALRAPSNLVASATLRLASSAAFSFAASWALRLSTFLFNLPYH